MNSEKKETISFVIPCYNSTHTIGKVVQEIKDVMQTQMSRYNYEMYADMLRLVKADVFRERMQTLLDESAAQPVTVPLFLPTIIHLLTLSALTGSLSLQSFIQLYG